MTQDRIRWLPIALSLVGGGCVHERLEQRGGCWVRHVETGRGDTREEIAACEPKPPEWSADPLVRSIEDCLYDVQQARYYGAALGAGKTDWNSAAAKCLAESEKLALERIERVRSQLEASQAQVGHLDGENKELRQSLVACVEKTPNAVANASATTQSASDSGNTPSVRVETAPSPPARPVVRRALPAAAPVQARPVAAHCDCPQGGAIQTH